MAAFQELTPVEQRMLTFERQVWKYTGSKDRAIRHEFGVSPVSYYYDLAQLILRDEAVAFDPRLVRRLREARSTRRRADAPARHPEMQKDADATGPLR